MKPSSICCNVRLNYADQILCGNVVLINRVHLNQYLPAGVGTINRHDTFNMKYLLLK